ncbi:hypothetical protein BEN48_17600 [Hymenobacter glacialis]|uniref:histidine kinase n=2 Tax=Hymenobacter glacialis TaxID=1908236 RepID=A0A1G1SV51_9BACT|nr:hypothetical protein BEN48_17600 [Hymenobacter glacialis]
MELRNNAPLESAQFFQQALSLSQQIDYTIGAAEAQLGLGFYHRHRSEYDLAQAYSMRAEQGFRQVSNPLGQTRSLYNLSCVYSAQGMYAKSLTANLKGLELAEAMRDKKWLSFLNTQLGITSMFLAEYAHAQEYLSEGLDWARKSKDKISIGHAYSGLGDLYRVQKQWAQALAYYKKAVAIFKELQDESGVLFEDINIGDMHERLEHYPQAFAYGYRGLGRAHRLYALNEMPRAQLLLARAYLHTDQLDSAAAFGRRALQSSQISGAKAISRDASEVLSQAYAQMGQYKDAYRYEQLFSSYKDTLNSSDLQRRAAVLEYRAQLDQKQAQIGLLTKNSQLIRRQNRAQQWILLGALLSLGAVASLSLVLWRNNAQKQRAYALLKQQQDELHAAQGQLVQAEKWALVGELSAGIAHELQNPLNFMKNFAEVSVAMLTSDQVPRAAGSPEAGNLEQEIMAGLKQNLLKISQHGQRASSIINDMLEHARTGIGEREITNINSLADEALALAYHGLRTEDSTFQASLDKHLDAGLPAWSVVKSDLSRVLLNLCTNALYAVRERQQKAAATGSAYEPTVTVATHHVQDKVEIRVRDNGTGMTEDVRQQIFQPFFTTKPNGEGTGLGLSLSHDIVTKGHGGTLTVESYLGEGTEFIIIIPA